MCEESGDFGNLSYPGGHIALRFQRPPFEFCATWPHRATHNHKYRSEISDFRVQRIRVRERRTLRRCCLRHRWRNVCLPGRRRFTWNRRQRNDDVRAINVVSLNLDKGGLSSNSVRCCRLITERCSSEQGGHTHTTFQFQT